MLSAEDSDFVAKVRILINLGPDAVTDDLILAMDGTPEYIARRITEYLKSMEG
jgi:hypothetical protein